MIATTILEPQPTPNDAAAIHAGHSGRLADFERVCERLWPAVRFFGLCGASPEYVAAVAELGELLGKDGGSSQAIAAASAAAKRETIVAIAEWAKTAPEIRGIAGRSGQERFAEAIKGLK